MIAILLHELTSSVSHASVVADDGGPAWLLVLGPLGGAGVYFGLWRYYRNTDRSHSFERETRIQAQPIVEHDVKVDDITGTKDMSIEGDNHVNHRQRVQRLG